MRKLLLALGGLAILGAAPALADDQTCIRRNDIRDWASPASKALILETSAHRRVLLQLTSGCSGFGVYDQLAISGPLESSISCVAAGDTVSTSYAGEPGTCRIVSVTPYRGAMPRKSSHL